MAASIQFRFPECQKIDLNVLITRASGTGLELLEELLLWDSDKRPTAQNSLKYQFFQIIKRNSDTVHTTIPLTTIHTAHQQSSQQQQQQQSHQIIPNGRLSNMSFASLDNLNDKYSNEIDFITTKNVSLANTNKYITTNAIKHPLLDDNRRKSIANFSISNNNSINGNHMIDYNEDKKIGLHNENGINFSVLNGPYISNTTTLNNHQSECSMDTSENVFRTNGPNSGVTALRGQIDSGKQAFRENMNSRTDISSITTQNSIDSTSMVGLSQYGRRPSKINEQNLSNETLRSFSTNDNNSIVSRDNAPNVIANEEPHKNERLNGFGRHRKNSATENSPFFNEKISDIFVNRNIGAHNSKLYHSALENGNVQSIYSNKLYNGSINDENNKMNKNFDATSNEYGHSKTKSFFLHEKQSTTTNNANNTNYGDSKVYNIFSKQRITQPIMYDNNHNEEENSYLATKLSAKSVTRNHKVSANWNLYENDDLTNILG